MLLAIDTETTGVDHTTADIVQIAAVSLKPTGGREIVMNSLCYPESNMIPEEASNVHGVFIEHVAGMVSDVRLAKTLRAVVGTFQPSTILTLVTYNGCNYDLPLLSRKGCHLLNHDHIDVYHLVQRDLHSYGLKLSEVYENYIGRPLDGAHEATADCHACITILQKFCEEREMDEQMLIDYMAKPVLLDAFPFGKHKGKEFGNIPRGYLRWARDNFNNVSPDMAFTLQAHVG